MIQSSSWKEPVGCIIPRDHQIEDVAKSCHFWNSGEVGVLTRAATGRGNAQPLDAQVLTVEGGLKAAYSCC